MSFPSDPEDEICEACGCPLDECNCEEWGGFDA